MSAPEAPMAPAWFTVAIPVIIDPKTKKIRPSGGTSVMSTFPQNAKSIEPLYRTAGAALGLTIAYNKINSIYTATSTRPGTKAPKNISPALVDPTSNMLGIDISPVASLCSSLRADPA